MTKHQPEEIRRKQILDAARKCFVVKGYFPTRMEDIAKEAGLSKGGIYFHFEGKRQVFEALVKEEYERFTAFLEELGKQTASVPEMIANMGRHYLDFYRERIDYARFFMVMGEMAGRDESVREMLASLQNEYTRVLSGIVKAGIDAGVLKSVDPEATATLLKGIIDAMQGYFALGVNLDVQRILSTGMEIVMHGMAKS